MRPLQNMKLVLQKPLLFAYGAQLGVWVIILPLLIAVTRIALHSNNYLIFRGVFWHTVDGSSLYTEYPAEYFDMNHYGPFFSLVIAPFALLPVWIGGYLWVLVLALSLYYGIRKLPFSRQKLLFIYCFCLFEMYIALMTFQFNVAIAAMIVATFYCVQNGKEGWAAFFIVLGTFVKVYCIVGLAFFFFSSHKKRFVLYMFLWSVVAFVSPMLLSSPSHILSQYVEWWHSVSDKNLENMFAIHQNVSLLGLIRKISGCAGYSDLWIILGGLILFGLPYLRIKQYTYPAFRYTLLASVLLFTVLFSTGSESSSYIIAMVGVAIWYVASPWKRSKWDIALMVFAFFLTSFCAGDPVPAYIRWTYIEGYALKALPCAFIWLKLTYEMCFRDYAPLEKVK